MRPYAFFLGFLALATLAFGWALDTALALRDGAVTPGGLAAGTLSLTLLVVSFAVLLRIVGRAAAATKMARRSAVPR